MFDKPSTRESLVVRLAREKDKMDEASSGEENGSSIVREVAKRVLG